VCRVEYSVRLAGLGLSMNLMSAQRVCLTAAVSPTTITTSLSPCNPAFIPFLVQCSFQNPTYLSHSFTQLILLSDTLKPFISTRHCQTVITTSQPRNLATSPSHSGRKKKRKENATKRRTPAIFANHPNPPHSRHPPHPLLRAGICLPRRDRRELPSGAVPS